MLLRSLRTGVFYFLGDYVGAADSLQLDGILKASGDHRILFADHVTKLNRNGQVTDLGSEPRLAVGGDGSGI